MVLFDILGTEDHILYQQMEVANGVRQYDFLRSIVEAAVATGRPYLSQHLLKALNFHAITCLHTSAGEYRPCPVVVGDYSPPPHYRVDALMEEFVNQVNRYWENNDEIVLAAHVLWKLNHIHPFINGNGRTARAACYFVLCIRAGRWLPGNVILPELLRREREAYVQALKVADQGDFAPLHQLLSKLLDEQLQDAVLLDGAPPAPESEAGNA
jgi:Fic family protein